MFYNKTKKKEHYKTKNVDTRGEANIKWQQSIRSKAQMDLKHNVWCKASKLVNVCVCVVPNFEKDLVFQIHLV
jgi:hypothetical protein